MTPSTRLLFLVSALALIPLAGPRPSGSEDVYAQEKCSLCHIRESVFFDSKLLKSEIAADLGEERVCRSCHNGSVRDSRAVLWRGTQHPPPGGKGRRPCSRCHSPHGRGGWEVLAGTNVPLKGGGDPVCAGCHPDHRSGAGTLHAGRFPAGGCQECHRAHGAVGKALLRDTRNSLCLRCHAAANPVKGAGHPSLEGTSASTNGGKPSDCTGCHPVHRGGAATAGLIESRCAGCHPFARWKGKDVGQGHMGGAACTACHLFHTRSGETGKGLRGRDMRTDILCGACHPSYRAIGISASREKGTHVTPRREGKEDLCLACHAVHGAVRGTPLLRTAKSYSCLECHPRQNPIREGGAALSHPIFEQVAHGRLDNVVRTRGIYVGAAAEIACRTCHAVHGANPGTPLLATGFSGDENCFWCHEEKRGAGHHREGKGGPEAGCAGCHPVHGIAEAGPDPWKRLCTKCHPVGGSHVPGREDRTAGRPKDLPLFDKRGRVVELGGVSCPTCHEPHGAPARGKRIRRAYTPSGFLCTACHRSEESVALTPHDLRGIVGDSICEPCHKPHGGRFPGMWGLTAGPEEAGERCRFCHREKGLGTPVPAGGHPVNMVVTRPLPAIYPLFGEGLETRRWRAMTCATCHDVHGTGFIPQGQGTGKLLRAYGTESRQPPSPGSACLPCHPGRETAHGKAGCAGCHPPHRAESRGRECGGCHPMPEEGIARTHGSAGRDCGSCHRVHADADKIARSGARCLECHSRMARIARTPHGELGEGTCGACHPAHAALEINLTKRRAWEEIFVTDAQCTRCHREGGKGPVPRWSDHPKNKRKVQTTYGATVVLESPIIMVGRLQEGGNPLFPLFSDNGIRSLSGRMGCLTCHDPHAGPTLEGGERKAAAYLRDPTGVFLTEICLPCHREGAAERVRKFHALPRKTD